MITLLKCLNTQVMDPFSSRIRVRVRIMQHSCFRRGQLKGADRFKYGMKIVRVKCRTAQINEGKVLTGCMITRFILHNKKKIFSWSCSVTSA